MSIFAIYNPRARVYQSSSTIQSATALRAAKSLILCIDTSLSFRITGVQEGTDYLTSIPGEALYYRLQLS